MIRRFSRIPHVARLAPRFVSSLLLALLATGCAKKPGAKLETGIATMRREESPAKLFERGRAFAQIGDFVRAEQYLAAALDAGADPRATLPLLLHACIEGHRYRVALDYAESYLRKHPRDQKLRFVVGSLYAAIGDAPAARQRYETLLRDQPDHADAHYAMAVLLRDELAEWELADHHFREYLRLAPKGEHAEEARASLLQRVP